MRIPPMSNEKGKGKGNEGNGKELGKKGRGRTDRHTDGRTDRRTHDDSIHRVSIASRGKKEHFYYATHDNVFKLDLGAVKINHQVKRVGEKSFRSIVIICTQIQRGVRTNRSIWPLQ